MAQKFQNKHITRYQHLYILPLLFLLLIFPFLVGYRLINNPMTGNLFYPADGLLADIFLYVKSHALILTAIGMVCVFVCDLTINARSHGLSAHDYKKFLPLVVYAFFIILSTLCAENKELALHGMPGQFETIWILLAYLVICIFSYWYTTTVDNKKLLVYAFTGSTFLIGIVSLLQFIGFDPYIALFSGHNATVAVSGVYGTFYNPNYAGSYIVLILPVLAASAIVLRKKKPLFIICTGSLLLLLLALYGTKTSGGILVLLLCTAFALLFLIFRKLHFSVKSFLIMVSIFITVLATTVFLWLYKAGNTDRYISDALETIYTNDDCIEIHRGNNILSISVQYTDTTFSLICTDENGKNIIPVSDGTSFTFDDERFMYFSITPMILSELNDRVCFMFTYHDYYWYFTNDTSDGAYYYITTNGSLWRTAPGKTDTDLLFKRIPNFLSGRGYIWSRSIPLLKETLVIGYGPDNFAEHFPNGDFADAFYGGFYNTFISKPHNMYLQIALQTGLPSLIAFLAFYLLYFIQSVRIYLTADFQKGIAAVGFGILLGTIGYMTIGLINDSTLTVAPFFWLMLGIGFAINRIYIKEN